MCIALCIPVGRRGARGQAILAALALLVLAAGPAIAQNLAAPPPALGMAVPLADPGMANVPPATPPLSPQQAEPRPAPALTANPVILPPVARPLRGLGSGLANEGGQLPNQKTGHRHEHVVRDICIGC